MSIAALARGIFKDEKERKVSKRRFDIWYFLLITSFGHSLFLEEGRKVF